MQARWRFALAVAVLAALMTGPFVLTAVMVWADTPAETRSALHLLADRWLPLGVLTTLAGFAVGIALLGRLFRHYVQGLLRMAEGLDVLRRANPGFRVPEEGPREVVALAQAINRHQLAPPEITDAPDARPGEQAAGVVATKQGGRQVQHVTVDQTGSMKGPGNRRAPLDQHLDHAPVGQLGQDLVRVA